MATCKVYGYIVDGSENVISGVPLQFIPALIPAVDSSTGRAVIPRTIEVFTTSTGYFEVYLLVNTNFVVIINCLGMKEVIRVPHVVSKNLFELTGMYTSGDVISTSTGESNPTEPNW